MKTNCNLTRSFNNIHEYVHLRIIVAIFIMLFIPVELHAQAPYLLNEPIDISPDFRDFANTYFLADSLSDFDPSSGKGHLIFRRFEYTTRMAFDNMLAVLDPVPPNEFPRTEYEASPSNPFQIQFVSPRTVRIRIQSGPEYNKDGESLMLVNGKAPEDKSTWRLSRIEGGYKYTSPYGSVTVTEYPWHVEIRDSSGKLLTRTIHNTDNAGATFTPVLPFSYVRRASDYSRSMSAVFSLSPEEKIFGCGESFTRFDKRGQKVILWTDDANGVQNETMYKPIPFYMSSRGYGLFMHTSSPITCDFGRYFGGVTSLMLGDDVADIFVFLGKPKDILDEYTTLTGKSPMPPLWSFGFWMSRITYFSEAEGRKVAELLRKYRVPADVIHFDTGWFGVDWRNDYKFAPDRFPHPEKMISDLKKEGFHISLWQLPYFTPRNSLFPEIIEKGLAVKDKKGNIPYEDAILDFSNPETVTWYQDKIAGLLEMGVGAIKVDFGEAAPHTGLYHSGKTGFYEHNLYPLRYNKAVGDITWKIHGEHIMWARSTWAGSQRYPVHWGGDAANTNTAMAATLRGGLSLGLCGFSFWSHDIGGFVKKTPEDIYRRWTPFGMLSSHTRSHGAPPKEPWDYSDSFLNAFRLADDMRYQLMPYIYSQAKNCSEKGLPMVRALFVEYPDDPGSWNIDDQYMFGSDMLVAPLFEEVSKRDVYLPPGQWIDYQTGNVYSAGWHLIQAGKIPIIMLIKNGSVIPHIKLAQSTLQMDWSKLDLVVFATNDTKDAKGLIYLPDGEKLFSLEMNKTARGYLLASDPLKGKVKWNIKSYNER